MQVDDVYEGYEAYGGSGHCLGLFKVVKLGAKFASLRGIECKQVEEPSVQSSPADYHSSGKRMAVLPLTENGKRALVAYNNYDAEREEAIVDNGGSMCYKTYKLVKPDDHGNYIYTSRQTLYG